MKIDKVMLVGSFGPGALENSYASAFRDNNCEIITFDITDAIKKNCRLGRAGQLFNKFVPVEPWIRKANREMILKIKHLNPDILIVFGQNRVLTSALAQVKAMFQIKTVYIWQDTLLDMGNSYINSLRLYDLICTYSKSSIKPLEELGGRKVLWLPLAADPSIHSNVKVREEFKCDISFIGQWRPEREAAVSALINQIPGISVKLWGPDWKRRSKDQRIVKAWQGRSLYGKEFAQAIVSSTFNLNIIDDTNYPAANMRFFEIPCAGGLQICSVCPEMEPEFKNGETTFYFKNHSELAEIVKSLLNDKSTIDQVRHTANIKIMEGHTYIHRAQKILELLNFN
jgi:spore maturation protein CgeB